VRDCANGARCGPNLEEERLRLTSNINGVTGQASGASTDFANGVGSWSREHRLWSDSEL
jgi:hypothetical protein